MSAGWRASSAPGPLPCLDGVDDFLVNHPTMGLSYVVDTLRGAVGRYRDNPGFAVVASVRSGLHGLERLASRPPDVVEVLRLSVAQAERTFPTCRRWLAQVSDLRVLDLVLTPLILSSFEPECDSEVDRRSLTAGSIMDQTIRPILRRSHLVGLRLADEKVVESFTLVPEVLELYRNCQVVHAELDVPAD